MQLLRDLHAGLVAFSGAAAELAAAMAPPAASEADDSQPAAQTHDDRSVVPSCTVTTPATPCVVAVGPSKGGHEIYSGLNGVVVKESIGSFHSLLSHGAASPPACPIASNNMHAEQALPSAAAAAFQAGPAVVDDAVSLNLNPSAGLSECSSVRFDLPSSIEDVFSPTSNPEIIAYSPNAPLPVSIHHVGKFLPVQVTAAHLTTGNAGLRTRHLWGGDQSVCVCRSICAADRLMRRHVAGTHLTAIL